MKKTLLAIVALATAVTMNAGAFNFARRVLTPSSTIKVAQKSTADAFAMLRTYGAPQKAKSLNDLAKEYVTVNILPTTKCVTNHEVTVTVGTEPNTIIFKNLCGGGKEIKATVDLAAGTFSIAPGQVVFVHDEYGNNILYTYTTEGGKAKIDKQKPITGVINDDGTIEINTPYGGFIASGQYAGQFFSDMIFTSSIFKEPNGKMALTQKEKAGSKNIESKVIITQDVENHKAIINNFGGWGFQVAIDVKKDSTIAVSTDVVIEAGEEQGNFYPSSNLEGVEPQAITGTIKGHPNQIDFDGKWTVMSTTGYWFNECSAAKTYFTNAEKFIVDGDPSAVENVATTKTVAGISYVNLAGMQSATPFNGVNLVVTRYSDGTVSTTKVMK